MLISTITSSLRTFTNGIEVASVPCSFTYDLNDPYAISCDFGGVSWVFARDLLREALADGRSGLCDVQINMTNGDSEVWISLISPEGNADIGFPTNLLADFLEKSYTVCAPGNEKCDIDSMIKECLGE